MKFHIIIMPKRPVQVPESLKMGNENIVEERAREVEGSRVPHSVSGKFSNQ
jgi:hypothetical protein